MCALLSLLEGTITPAIATTSGVASDSHGIDRIEWEGTSTKREKAKERKERRKTLQR